ncbi:right-handed parallel beta-helix repeat-containing protein [Alicyclobacillus fastidiosus]|uniref:Right-handed parallel beta-helix repeat-containing protein n=1 Tax=Alicyclobacillus fastidiosus TaxID=392011 RepID=A0ABV5A9S0_9BACL|nr:right-handed parallel beta-helix repeat-containing protein [Alicyclobacillus fastidiosus]WEH10939.1 right-handed parallel beta-helix repeat-containing protein [Alicyclobacillus fastidiosus]
MANEINVPVDQPTITAAIAAANTYDTIRVAPGIYYETVVIDKIVQLLGAQAGVDATSRGAFAMESIIVSSDTTGSVQIQSDNVVFDGFTVEMNTQWAGIFAPTTVSGYSIQNNIIRNNVTGMYVHSNGEKMVQIRNNLLVDNSGFGNAIYSSLGASNLLIEANYFAGGHSEASINIGGDPGTANNNLTIARNRFFRDNSIALTSTTNVKLIGNTMQETQGSSVFFGGATNYTEIDGNVLEGGISSGIRVTTAFSGGVPNANIVAHDNSIQGNAVAGLNLDTGAYDAATPNLRLDATNNWWGSPTGPAPIGTGNSVIDPDGVTEYVPFLTSNPLPAPEVVRTTGPVLRTGTDAQSIYVSILNNDTNNQASIQILGFDLSDGSKVPYVHELFYLSPVTDTTRTYHVQFTSQYEFQFGMTGTLDVNIAVWGLDSSGKVISSIRLVAEEMTSIQMLTPGVP